jgi:glycoprotein endo-alpha-1,2-mannosidase
MRYRALLVAPPSGGRTKPVRLLCGVACAALFAFCAPVPAFAGGVIVSAFYYPWFGTSPEDGDYAHWAQNGHAPPVDIASNYYPVYGPYSSSNAAVIAAQFTELQRAGINELAVSWWGRGSPEDQRLQEIVTESDQTGVAVAAHIEPYAGRTVASITADAIYLRSLGVRTVYVYQAFAGLDPADWAPANDALHAQGLTTFAQTGLIGQAATAHFSGIYTYDTVTYGARVLSRLCSEAHAKGLLCAPSVGPGYDARRAVGDPHVKPRNHGQTYDAMWHAALSAGADRITITSFNEWQEGTQIEPAAAALRLGAYRYFSYDGAWGLHGVAAENSYLDRTAYWANLFAQQVSPKRSQ